MFLAVFGKGIFLAQNEYFVTCLISFFIAEFLKRGREIYYVYDTFIERKLIVHY